MKALIKISVLLVLIAIITPAHSQGPVHVMRTRNQYQFVFKVQKEMLGAHVGIQSEAGNQINS
ncbi:MAG TPA: hypothetical protein PLJ08_19580, partial [Cyclobacteriaceae bacterium]|nr:hypothetical protein [Cyclobacteriaceae bacterium]